MIVIPRKKGLLAIFPKKNATRCQKYWPILRDYTRLQQEEVTKKRSFLARKSLIFEELN